MLRTAAISLKSSVRLNNTLQEDWTVRPDSGSQWSHCPVVPLYIAFTGLAGIRPLAPGFKRVEIRPQPADLEQLELAAHTVRGPLRFLSRGGKGKRQISIGLPPGCDGELVIPSQEKVTLDPAAGPAPPGHRRFQMPAGKEIVVFLYSV